MILDSEAHQSPIMQKEKKRIFLSTFHSCAGDNNSRIPVCVRVNRSTKRYMKPHGRGTVLCHIIENRK